MRGDATFSVVVPTLGRPDEVDGALARLAGCCPRPLEVLVVDGDPAASASPVVDDWAGRGLAVRHLPSPPGLTRQRNVALDACCGDVVVMVDDDARVPPDALARLAAAYRDPGVVGATGRIVEPGGNAVGGKASPLRRWLPGGGAEGGFTRYGYPRRLVDLDAERDVSFMQGAFLSARREAAQRVRFDERLPGYALAEDEDFSCRLARLGRLRYLPDLVVDHGNEGFTTRDRRAFGRTVVVHRAYLFRKNFRQTTRARLQFRAFFGLLVLHRLANRDWAGARGLLDGIAAARRGVVPAGADDPLPVAFVSSHAELGGSERYLEQLLGALDGVDPALVVALADGPFVARLRALGQRPVVVATGPGPVAIVRSARALRRHVRRSGARVVHANGVKAALVAVLAGIGGGPPVVWVKHDFSWDGALARGIARRSRLVVGVSEAVVAGLDGRAELRVVRTGLPHHRLDRSGARAALVAARPALDGAALVTLVGRLHPVKGHLVALDALELVRAAVPTARLLLVGGEDPNEPAHATRVRARVAERGLDGAVVDLGHRDDALEVVAASDVVLVPSVPDDRGFGREGFGLVALEAMAAGTPVVASADGALPEVLGGCGVLVPPGDVRALADATLGLLKDDDRRAALAACGQARARASFPLDAMARAMADCYREAAW
jgi:glycosyltransferase involved in cell wall biosynthesis